MSRTTKVQQWVGVVGVWGMLGWVVQAQVPPTYPAGQTTFAVDIPVAGPTLATTFQLEFDGTEIPGVSAGAFTTGTFEFPAIALAVGLHTVRARACKDWGTDTGGVLCSAWTPALTFQAVASGAPNVPEGLRIRRVLIEVGQP